MFDLKEGAYCSFVIVLLTNSLEPELWVCHYIPIRVERYTPEVRLVSFLQSQDGIGEHVRAG